MSYDEIRVGPGARCSVEEEDFVEVAVGLLRVHGVDCFHR